VLVRRRGGRSWLVRWQRARRWGGSEHPQTRAIFTLTCISMITGEHFFERRGGRRTFARYPYLLDCRLYCCNNITSSTFAVHVRTRRAFLNRDLRDHDFSRGKSEARR
jgi:hypothetical protein